MTQERNTPRTTPGLPDEQKYISHSDMEATERVKALELAHDISAEGWREQTQRADAAEAARDSAMAELAELAEEHERLKDWASQAIRAQEELAAVRDKLEALIRAYALMEHLHSKGRANPINCAEYRDAFKALQNPASSSAAYMASVRDRVIEEQKQVCYLALDLETTMCITIVEEVQKLRTGTSVFDSGYDLACDEILERLNSRLENAATIRALD